MTTEQFNKKYHEYLEEGHYGLDLYEPSIVEYLDKIFAELIKIPGFKYFQIKEKFHAGRFYSNLHSILPTFGNAIEREIEHNLNIYLKVIEHNRK